MSNISENTLNIGLIFKSISGIAVFVFLIWTTYFSGYFELSFLRGIIIFIIIAMFLGFLSGIPFGITFAPVIFEWWIFEAPLSGISTFAWVVTGISLIANLLIILGFASMEQK
jgi:hypothetical protein